MLTVFSQLNAFSLENIESLRYNIRHNRAYPLIYQMLTKQRRPDYA
jgi:hypothetical protein